MLPGTWRVAHHSALRELTAPRPCAELLRFSSASHLLEQIPDEVQAHHRASETRAPARAVARATNADVWAGWGDAGAGIGARAVEDDEESLDLDGVL